ncbi:MAG TPA: mechanosensitive ion channel protein [Planctomycetaceae bacterium]|nr:mechanosensitive ion channel protein [Blastopirellula sp.]HAY78521.1 mechanosensitive ion channel protein [Planctomycetaceae bacterium]
MLWLSRWCNAGRTLGNSPWCVALATVILSGTAATSRAFAQDDSQESLEEATTQMQVQAEQMGSLLLRAIQGDQDALLELATGLAAPAIVALLVLVVGFLVASFLGRVAGAAVSKRVDVTLGKFFGKMVRALLMITLALGVLGYFGIDVTSFAAIMAAAGFAIGMALQGTLSNFAAGVMILVFRPFCVGDFISAGGVSGTVDEVDLFTTRLNTTDNRYLIVPNSAIFGSTIENVTHHETRRVDVSVGVDYSADLQTVREVLLRAVEGLDGVLGDPSPVVVLAELGDSAVVWQIRVWCQTGDYGSVKERVNESVKLQLDAANINIPYPTMDVRVTNS